MIDSRFFDFIILFNNFFYLFLLKFVQEFSLESQSRLSTDYSNRMK